jgi:predicted outer membrane protein
MRRHFFTRTAALGSLLALAAGVSADTIGGNDTSKLVATASIEHSAPDAEPGKASIFGVPREARVLFW